MPVQRGTSSLSNLIKKHAQDETVYSNDYVSLPGGIHGGVAQLVEAKLGVYKSGPNQGKDFLYLAGVVVAPKTATEVIKTLDGKQVKVVSAKEIVIEGQRTALTLPLCDVKKQDGTITPGEDNVERALNEVRKVGGDTENLEGKEDLEELLSALKEASPYFRFSTSQADPTPAYPNPRVWENWHGVKGLESYVPEESNGVMDRTPEVQKEGSGNGSEEGGEEGGEEDLNDLARRAEEQDLGAANRLETLGVQSGLTNKQIIAARDWMEVVDLIREKQMKDVEQEQEESGEREEEDDSPKKGDVYLYHPIDPKTKKPAKKAVECEIVSINPKAQTAELKSLDNPRVKYVKIPWGSLESL